MEFIFFIGFVLLIFYTYQYVHDRIEYGNSIIFPAQQSYVTNSNEIQIQKSKQLLADKFNCTTDRVKERYFKELRDNSFNLQELIETEAAWREKRIEESAFLGIKVENTPASLLEQWTKEYRIINF